MSAPTSVSGAAPKVDSTSTPNVESKSTVSKATSWVKASYINPQNWTMSGVAKATFVAVAALTAFAGAVWKGFVSIALPYVGTISQATAFNAFAVGAGAVVLTALLYVGSQYLPAKSEKAEGASDAKAASKAEPKKA